jgi:hypothetical protein
LKLEAASGRSVVGRWFADLAAREAASVEAFSILQAELASHRAPRRLLAGARRAARDEVRHARVIGAIASCYGGKLRPPRIEHRAIRSLEAIATENAVEGCDTRDIRCARRHVASAIRERRARPEGDERYRTGRDPPRRTVLGSRALD